MNLRYILLLALLRVCSPASLAVTEVAPDAFNKGNWNREELLDHLKRSWESEDMSAMSTWFNAEAAWKPIWVKITFWRQPDSEFKRKVVIMMLRGSPMAWGDPPPGDVAMEIPASPERESTIEGCLEVIRSAAPALPVAKADFESFKSRLALAERFEAGIARNEPLLSTRDRESSAEGDQASQAEAESPGPRKKFLGLPLEWLLIIVGVALGSVYVARKSRI